MDIYGQEPEARLLRDFLPHLANKSVVDVGAERGSFVGEMLDAGSDAVYAIEPDPANAQTLRNRWGDDPRVRIFACAAGSADGVLNFHRAVDRTGAAVTYAGTVLELPPRQEIAWGASISVPGRSLDSLVAAGDIPARVGIVKIDTEGHDFAVVNGMDGLDCDVVMVEHWLDLPSTLGRCPWTVDDLAGRLGPRGFRDFAFVAHLGEFSILKWNDAEVPVGCMGNLVFFHERALADLLPTVLASGSQLAAAAVETGEMYAEAARDRLALVERLQLECEQRLSVIEELQEKRRQKDVR